ncbi:MAG: hypothetical protein K1X74_21080 [Pirellulales bacterium]|nr:hypothetical protein [Pirellulales bacterium]
MNRKRSALGEHRLALAVLVGLFAVACATHVPYFSAPHLRDDRYMQFLAGLRATGRIGWAAYLLRPYEGHFLAGWRLVYLLQLRAFGLTPWAWHVCVFAVHALGAWFVYLLLTRWLHDRFAAGLGAAIWAAAAIGGWDNPLLWPCCALNAHGLTWLLGAMYCQAHFTETGKGGWLAGMLVCLVAGVLMWGPILLLSAIVPLQAYLLGRPPDAPRRWQRAVIAWMIAAALLGTLQTVVVTLAGVPATLKAQSLFDVAAIARSVASQAYTAFVHLAGLGPVSIEHWPSIAARAVTAMSVVAVFLVPGIDRRVVAIFVALGLLHLLAARVFRGELPVAATLGWGRYLYVATLSWAVMAAAVLAGMRRWSLPGLARTALTAALALVAIMAIARQYALATQAANLLTQFARSELTIVQMHQQALQKLRALAIERHQVLRVPDIPVDVPPALDVYFPLSAFAAVCIDDDMTQLMFVPGDTWTASDQRLWSEAIRLASPELAQHWTTRAEQLSEWAAAADLFERAQRTQRRQVVLPNVQISAPPLSIPLPLLLSLVRHEPLHDVEVLAPAKRTARQWEELTELLELRDQPGARLLRDAYLDAARQAADSPPQMAH